MSLSTVTNAVSPGKSKVVAVIDLICIVVSLAWELYVLSH